MGDWDGGTVGADVAGVVPPVRHLDAPDPQAVIHEAEQEAVVHIPARENGRKVRRWLGFWTAHWTADNKSQVLCKFHILYLHINTYTRNWLSQLTKFHFTNKSANSFQLENVSEE